MSHRAPPERDYQSVQNWFRNTMPIVKAEMQYIRHKEDLISLDPTPEEPQKEALNSLIERVVKRLDMFLSRSRWPGFGAVKVRLLSPKRITLQRRLILEYRTSSQHQSSARNRKMVICIITQPYASQPSIG